MSTQLEFDWGDEIQFVASVDDQDAGVDVSVGGEGAASGVIVSDDTIENGAVQGQYPMDLDAVESPAQRMVSLEQALKQCQSYIDELKAQLSDQAFLEAQLAATEEFSHIQKQAIVTLKLRLSDQAEVEHGELETLQQQRTRLEAELGTVQDQWLAEQAKSEALQRQLEQEQQALQEVQAEVGRLSVQIDLSQDSVVKETQQRIIAQTTAERLRTSLREREGVLQTLEVKLQRANEHVEQQQTVIGALKKTSQSDSHKNQAIQNLSSTLLKAQTKIAGLESQVSQQAILQAQFQHSTQEIEAKAHNYQDRSEQLEQQVAEMQEQILHQAQQASEYETAVQHWKDRCVGAEHRVGQLKELLGHLLCDVHTSEPLADGLLEDAIAEMMASLEDSQRLPEAVGATRKNLKLDLPAIMHRWRNSKV